MTKVLILGSGPEVTRCRDWDRAPFDVIVAINNAWRVRPDWDVHIHPEDFPQDRRPKPGDGQRIVTAPDYVPLQNRYGGFLYAGGTMAFTAAYWALAALSPRVVAVLGCDMVYEGTATHFYGKGTADPLRADKSLRSLEAKSARFMLLAARQGCAAVNLGTGPTRLVFPHAGRDALDDVVPVAGEPKQVEAALAREAALGYVVPSGRYWLEEDRFDVDEIDALDALWLKAARPRGKSR